MSKIDIGILEVDCEVIVDGFKKVLVDLYILYL